MKGVVILGATGTIGVNTLDVVGQHPERFHVVALTAHRNVAQMVVLCVRWQPAYAVMADADAAGQLAEQLRASAAGTVVLSGVEGLTAVVRLPSVDVVMAAIVGAAGLLPTLAAAQAGKRVLLANKEALVMSGQLFMDAVRVHQAELLPIDSEHNAIFQCMPAGYRIGDASVSSANGGAAVSQILLTASGGPFRSRPLAELATVTPAEACKHPNWVMGRKISVDSATMMNKGLEVIEACWLFAARPQAVEVVIHPQSVIHSLVAYVDGSVLAQLGNPDMRTPIAYGLGYPERIAAGVARLNLSDVARLDFLPMDYERFPCLALALQALQMGGTATTLLNAANEVAVEAFLAGKIGFTGIAVVIEKTLERINCEVATDLATILAADAHARTVAMMVIQDYAVIAKGRVYV